jgi:hypothetical protein
MAGVLECCICYGAVKSKSYVACGHNNICRKCVAKLKSGNGCYKCPMCRAELVKYSNISSATGKELMPSYDRHTEILNLANKNNDIDFLMNWIEGIDVKSSYYTATLEKIKEGVENGEYDSANMFITDIKYDKLEKGKTYLHSGIIYPIVDGAINYKSSVIWKLYTNAKYRSSEELIAFTKSFAGIHVGRYNRELKEAVEV